MQKGREAAEDGGRVLRGHRRERTSETEGSNRDRHTERGREADKRETVRTRQATPHPTPGFPKTGAPPSLTIGEWVVFLCSFWKEKEKSGVGCFLGSWTARAIQRPFWGLCLPGLRVGDLLDPKQATHPPWVLATFSALSWVGQGTSSYLSSPSHYRLSVIPSFWGSQPPSHPLTDLGILACYRTPCETPRFPSAPTDSV